MLKSKRNDIFIIIFLFVVTLGFLFVTKYVFYIKQVNLYNGKPYTKNSVAFVLSGSGESVDISKITESDNIEKCIILKLESQNGRYEVMYSGEKYLNLNTAKDIDFCSGENLVIGGADTDLKEGEILSIEGIDFCVRGKLKKHISPGINKGIFYTKCKMNKMQLYIPYVISAEKKSDVEKIYHDLCVTVKDNGMDLKRIELSEAQLTYFIDSEESAKSVFVIISFFYLICIVFICFLYMRINRRKIYVYELCGDMHIKNKLFLKYGIFVGVCLCVICFGMKYVK